MTRQCESDWAVVARWSSFAESEEFSQAPSEVLVRILPTASAKVRQRGVTSGVLRRAEALVAEMTEAMHEDYPGQARDLNAAAEQYATSELTKMPASPRDGGDYYGKLLELFDFMDEFWGHPEPLNLLARLSGVSRDTMKTRLRQARLRRAKPATA